MKLENGFVKITGASDLEDSPVAAGLCTIFDYPIEIDPLLYFNKNGMYQRCADSKYFFSRDQTIPLIALLRIKGLSHLVSLDHVDGKDVFSPSVKGHIKRCQGGKASWLQDTWLWLDVWFHAKVKPLEEPNQLIVMMWFADPKYLKWWCANNPHWEMSIEIYWISWRNEPELAALMIAAIKFRIATT